GFHAAGGRGIPGLGTEPGRLEPARDRLALAVRPESVVAARDRGGRARAVERDADASDAFIRSGVVGRRLLARAAGGIRGALSDDAVKPREVTSSVKRFESVTIRTAASQLCENHSKAVLPRWFSSRMKHYVLIALLAAFLLP